MHISADTDAYVLSDVLVRCMLYLFMLFFLLMIRRPPRSTRTDTLFPTRRSSDLLPRKWPQNYPAWPRVGPGRSLDNTLFLERLTPIPTFRVRSSYFSPVPAKRDPDEPLDWYEVELELLGIRDKYSLERMQTEDRKSTRLNSSH